MYYFSELFNAHFFLHLVVGITHGGFIVKSTHIISTTDPINGVNITDLKNHSSIVEGNGDSDLTIYFKSNASCQACLDMPVEHPEQGLSKTLSNPTDVYFN